MAVSLPGNASEGLGMMSFFDEKIMAYGILAKEFSWYLKRKKSKPPQIHRLNVST
ncbi:MAG: hypothetical protein LUQ29_07285 [Methylococcaceae bacterium]|nr:hypothetical protein [Methylococcaceae bacterium]